MTSLGKSLRLRGFLVLVALPGAGCGAPGRPEPRCHDWKDAPVKTEGTPTADPEREPGLVPCAFWHPECTRATCSCSERCPCAAGHKLGESPMWYPPGPSDLPRRR